MAREADKINDAEAAYQHVQAATEELRTEYDQVCADIVKTEDELKSLPLAPVPAEDLKASILEFVEASGRRYGNGNVRGAIASFATGGMAGLSAEKGWFGKPLRFREIEGAITGGDATMGWAQILTSDSQFNDQILYCFVSDLVKEGLRRVMADMTPEELGYGAINPNDIGTDCATRRKAIAAAKDSLATLTERRNDLATRLRRLGHRV